MAITPPGQVPGSSTFQDSLCVTGIQASRNLLWLPGNSTPGDQRDSPADRDLAAAFLAISDECRKFLDRDVDQPRLRAVGLRHP